MTTDLESFHAAPTLVRFTVRCDCAISAARWELRHGSKRKQNAAKQNLCRASHALMMETTHNGSSRQADASLTEAGKLLDILCDIAHVA